MKKQNFFNEDIVIEEKLFDNFKLDNIASWSHLELWCAIQNIDVDYAFFKGILCGTSVISKLYEVVLDAIENTEFLDKFIDNLETIEIIEKVFIMRLNSIKQFDVRRFWFNLAYKQDCMEYWDSDEDSIKKKYKLLNAIFKKNQFSAVKFYDKHKITIHHYDIDFEKWLLNSFKNIAKKSQLHFNIFKALEIEVKKQNNLAMYLN